MSKNNYSMEGIAKKDLVNLALSDSLVVKNQAFSHRFLNWLESGWAVLLFYVVMTAVFTWPLVTRLSDSLSDWGDPADLAWRIGAILRQLTTDPLHLYQTTSMFPVRNELALDELVTGQAFVAAPIWWLTHNAPLTYNLLNSASFTLSGWAMWLLVRRLTGVSVAGLVAGMIYAFSPWHYAEYGHLSLAAQQWMLLALFFLLRFIEKSQSPLVNPLAKRNWVNLALFVFFFVLQALVAGYLAYFEAILVGLFTAFYFLVERHWLIQLWCKLWRKRGKNEVSTNWWQLVCLVSAGFVAALIILPFIMPFIEAQQLYHFNRSLSEISYWSAAPTSFLRTSPQSWLYGPLEHGLFGLKTSVERALYPGVITLILVIVGLISPGRRFLEVERMPVRRWFFVGITLLALVLSFGPTLNLEAYGLKPTGISLPYQWFYRLVPGFDALRVPYRFGQLMMLGLAVLAGYGVARILKSRLRRLTFKGHRVGSVMVTLVLVSLVTADFIAPGVPITSTPTGSNAPALYHWLASPEATQAIPPDALFLEAPMALGGGSSPINTSSIYLMYSLSHGRPLLNGSANIIPPGYDRLFNEMQNFPNPATLDIAFALGVKFIIVHPKALTTPAQRTALIQEAGPGGRLKIVHRFPALDGDPRYKDVIYRLKAHPERFAKLAKIIPAGAKVFLGDDSSHHRLYTAVLPALIGASRTYFSNYTTIYSPQITVAGANQTYEYGIFYRGSNIEPAKYGYSPADLIPLNDNEIIQVYHKRSG